MHYTGAIFAILVKKGPPPPFRMQATGLYLKADAGDIGILVNILARGQTCFINDNWLPQG